MFKYQIEKLSRCHIDLTATRWMQPEIRVRVQINGITYNSEIHDSAITAIENLLENIKKVIPDATHVLENGSDYILVPDSEAGIIGDMIRRAIEPLMNKRGYVRNSACPLKILKNSENPD
jgi:hypothetical protein